MFWSVKRTASDVIEQAHVIDRHKVCQRCVVIIPRVISGAKQSCVWMHGDDSHAYICPVWVLFHVNEPRCWIWVHPSCWTTCTAMLSSCCTCTDIGDELVRYRVSGPTARHLLHRVLWCVVDHDDGDDVVKRSRTVGVSCCGAHAWHASQSRPVPDHSVISFQTFDPRLVPLTVQPVPLLLRGDGDDDGDGVCACPNIAKSSLWDRDIRVNQCKPTQSRIVNEMRRDMLTPSTSLAQILTKPSDHHNDFDRTVLSLVKPHVMVMHVSQPSDVYDVVLPAGWSTVLLSHMVKVGALPVGLSEMDSVLHQYGLPSFPIDSIFTTAGGDMSREIANRESTKWNRRQPSKRVNYAKLGIDKPFEFDWNGILPDPSRMFLSHAPAKQSASVSQSDYLTTRLEAMKKHPNLYSGMMNNFNGMMNNLSTHLTVASSSSPSSRDDDANAVVFVKVDAVSRGVPHRYARLYSVDDDGQRKLIGYVTSGEYSFVSCHGVGVGLVSRSSLSSSSKTSFRNVNSECYHDAICTINVYKYDV